MDIHAGGSDLKFPHHDNELAQSEAYYGHHQWCNYFFHAGHLHIKGLKMSKSLKNFTTIQQALKEYSARQLRLMFLMQPWDRPMNFSDQTVGAAKAKEAQLKNFFGTVKALLRTKWIEEEVGWRDIDVDRALSISILDTQSKVHAAFCDNFDTPSAINALTALVTECNNYLARPPPAAPAVYLLQKAGVYITQILKVLGVAEGSDEIGFPVSSAGSEAEVEGPLDALTEFRDTVRASKRRSCLPPLLFGVCQTGTHTRRCAVARKKGSTDAIIAACDEVSATSQSAEPVEARLGEQVAKVLSDFCATIRKEAVSGHIAVLDACDYVRDDALTEIGVRLEDATREGESSTWKLDDPETLKKEVAAKRAEAAERAKQAAQKNVAKKQKELAKLEAAALPVMEALAAEIAKSGLSAADLEAWVGMQPPPKAKGKPTPEFIAASKAAADNQVRTDDPPRVGRRIEWQADVSGGAGAVLEKAGGGERREAEGECAEEEAQRAAQEEAGAGQGPRALRVQGRRGVPGQAAGGDCPGQLATDRLFEKHQIV